jgi:hypothetical protein
MPKADNKVLKAKKTTFSSRHGLCNILFLPLDELGTCLRNLIPIRAMKHWEENYFLQRSMLKFTYKGNFLTKKGHTKSRCIETPNGEHVLWCLFYIQVFF